MFPNSLSSLPLISGARTRSISAENPTGEIGSGAMATVSGEHPARRLGDGWKVQPCIQLDAHSTTVLADIAGPGVIQHIWITVSPEAYRNTVIRMYWDNEAEPSVETPLGDLFCHGQNQRHTVVSLPIAVNPSGGFNSYWPMPFHKRALVTIENCSSKDIGGFFYQITWSETEIPAEAATFHAQWRRSETTYESPEHVILDGVQGQGHYVGTFLSWVALSSGWWGEGEIKFYLDDDNAYPSICGTGTEDYFGGAWGFHENGVETAFNTPFLGMPLARRTTSQPPAFELYRWHIMDPIRFQKRLKVTIQALGWYPDGTFQPLRDDIASLGVWYQVEPHASYPELPALHLRWPR